MYSTELDLFEQDNTIDDQELPGMQQFYLDYAAQIIARAGYQSGRKCTSNDICLQLNALASAGDSDAKDLVEELHRNGGELLH